MWWVQYAAFYTAENVSQLLAVQLGCFKQDKRESDNVNVSSPIFDIRDVEIVSSKGVMGDCGLNCIARLRVQGTASTWYTCVLSELYKVKGVEQQDC